MEVAFLILGTVGIAVLRLLGVRGLPLVLIGGGVLLVAALSATRELEEIRVWDEVAHLGGGMLIGAGLATRISAPAIGPGEILTIAGVVAALGIGWEVGELLADLIPGIGLSGTFRDTVSDVALAALGGIAGATAAGVWRSSRPTAP